MLPILFKIGSFEFHTMNLFLLMAFFSSAFVFWKKCKEEHYEQKEIFDGFLLSLFFSLLVSRLVFVLFNLHIFSFDILKWIDIYGYPGYSPLFGVMGMGIYMFRFSQKKGWDAYEILDFWAISMSLAFFFLSIGAFFEGVDYGLQTNLPWGVKFPAVISPHHPTQIYAAVIYLLLFIYLSWAESRYRLFEWYRAGKNTAQTGYLVSIFVIILSMTYLLLSLIKPAQYIIKSINIDPYIFTGFLLFSLTLLFNRSGRSFKFFKKKK